MNLHIPNHHILKTMLIDLPDIKCYTTRIPEMEEMHERLTPDMRSMIGKHGGCAYVDIANTNEHYLKFANQRSDEYIHLSNGECTLFRHLSEGDDTWVRIGIDNNHAFKLTDRQFESQALSMYDDVLIWAPRITDAAAGAKDAEVL